MTQHGSALGAPGLDGVAGAPSAVRPRTAATERAMTRPATPADVPEILALVRELADFERSGHEVEATEADLHALLFGGNTPSGAPAAHCLVIDAPAAEPVGDSGDPMVGIAGAAGPPRDARAPRLAGFALWFLTASTWLGRHGIHLEDLYVRPEHRGHGYGQLLMRSLAQICVERGYGRLEWSVLDWNSLAIGFYQSLGARGMDEWTVHRLSGPDLHALAGAAADAPPRASNRQQRGRYGPFGTASR